jgi:hypothetical protein
MSERNANIEISSSLNFENFGIDIIIYMDTLKTYMEHMVFTDIFLQDTWKTQR